MSLSLNQTFFDINSGYFLPTYTSSPHGLICGCDMCYDWNNLCPISAIGPHDLHCVCYDCCAFALQDEAYDEAMRCRYPDLFEELEAYTPPPNSPTNEEMHAYNGNSSWSDFIYAAARGAAGSQNPADKFAAGSLGAAGLLGTSLLYTSAQNMAKPLSELRDQIFGPSNKEMHTYNGNWDSILSGFGLGPVPTKVSDYYDTPQKRKKDREFHKDVETLFPSLETEIRAHDLGGMGELLDKKASGTNTRLRRKFTSPPLQPPKPEQVIHDITHHLQEKFPDIKGTPAMNIIHEELKQPEPNPQVIKDNLDKLAADHPEIQNLKAVKGPTNKEMHAINGNILHGPMNKNTSRKTHLNQLRRLKRKLNKRKFLKKGPKVNVNVKTGVAKSRRLPRGVKKAGKVENKERQIAFRYARFLRDPSIPPPRLGSTGNVPTKIIHGYFKQTYLMSAPAMGATPGLTNATAVIVAMYPKAFAYYGSRTNYSCPFVIAFANSDTTNFNDATNATLGASNFTNNTPMANEVGTGATGRFLGGHVSLECRCPMMNVAPPYIYGGSLPVPPTSASSAPILDPANYITASNGSTIRNFTQSKDVSGFEVSAVYVPDNPGALLNNGYIFAVDSGAAAVAATAVPYVGMVSCPTSASVTVTVSWWAEVYQNQTNANYSGWRLGPEVSSEDVYDNLPRNIPVVKPKALSQGVKDSAGYPVSLLGEKPKEITQAEKIAQLEEKLERLQLLIEEEEDEKYVHTDIQNSSLSRSTIDLALQLKDRLTPGSVTSKTSRSSLP